MIMTVVVTVSSFVIHINHDTSNDDIITIIRERLYVENHLAGSNPNGKIPVVLTNHEKMVIKKCFPFFFFLNVAWT